MFSVQAELEQRSSRIHSPASAYLGRAHVRHTPRAQSLLPALVAPPPPAPRPFVLSITIGASPSPPAPRAFHRPCTRRYTVSESSCTRLLFVSSSLLSSILLPFSLVFVPLLRVCLLRSLVGIIPRHGNYRYPGPHNATLTQVYNRRHTPANASSRY